MISNLSVNHIDGVTRAYGRSFSLGDGDEKAHWMLVVPKDYTMTAEVAAAIGGSFTGALVSATKFEKAIEVEAEPEHEQREPLKGNVLPLTPRVKA